MEPLTLFGIGAAAAAAGEVAVAIGPRRQRRKDLFKEAQARAKSTGKPLVVVGSPDAGIVDKMARSYGCGDVCIDLVGCDGCKNHIKGRLEDVLPKMRSDCCVIFVSCVLEYVDDATHCLKHLDRVSGGHLFVATVEPNSLIGWLYPGARRVFDEKNGVPMIPPFAPLAAWTPSGFQKEEGPPKVLPMLNCAKMMTVKRALRT